MVEGANDDGRGPAVREPPMVESRCATVTRLPISYIIIHTY